MLESEARVGKRFSVAIPGSVASDTPHLREKTAKLGAIARACSIFGVTEVILYPDDPHRDQGADLQFCFDILTYIETPQYLRRRLFKLSPTFKFTGILPPLQTPPHNVPSSSSQLKVGDLREGVVVGRTGSNVNVDAGLKETIECQGSYRIGERVTLQLTDLGKELRAQIVEPSSSSIYWGYRVTRSQFKLANMFQREEFDLRIGTSRYGTPVEELWSEISKSLSNVESVLIVFGSPRRGLLEILSQEGKKPTDLFHFFVNTVPSQQVATVRTEEALFITLGMLNEMKLK